MSWWQTLIDVMIGLWHLPLVRLGDRSVAVGEVIQLIVSLVVIFGLANFLKRFLYRHLLASWDEGNRNAIASLVSYSTAILAAIVAIEASGVSLSALAVPAGALGVGIGLGLQNLTKNFVSGLNLLLERKLRVGDYIDIDGLAGHIVDVSLRATVLVTRDGSRIIVPNSELVEKRVTNWYYDDVASRMHVRVTVAYGSDPLVVTETLLNAAYAEPMVRSEPAPTVLLDRFNDRGMEFDLRVWVSEVEFEPDIRSSLNFNIEHDLRGRGIEIAVVHHDIWLRNPEAMSAILRPDQDVPARPKPPRLPEVTISLPSLPKTLRQVAYFRNFSDLSLRKLIECGFRQRFRSGETLFVEGDPGNAFYILLSGVVEVRVDSLDKQLAILHPGDFFGELALMLGIPRTATVRSIDDAMVFILNRKGFKSLLQSSPNVAEAIVQALAERQEELAERQNELRAMGLIDELEDDTNPVVWVRRRLQNLFSL